MLSTELSFSRKKNKLYTFMAYEVTSFMIHQSRDGAETGAMKLSRRKSWFKGEASETRPRVCDENGGMKKGKGNRCETTEIDIF